jgi:ATP-dependent RNA helicase SUPV3L1/SUV3
MNDPESVREFRDILLAERAAAAAAAEGEEDFNLEDVDMNAQPASFSHLQLMSREIMEGRDFMPGARSVTWSGTNQSATLPELPQRNKRITELDWRTFLNLQQPHLWYPLARLLKRTIVFHCGPTNSGKTYRAMNRLKEASSGIYCGPLRLLAWEVHEKLNSDKVPCSLLTGQEVVEMPGAKHVACTVEMCNLEAAVDVAIIDEIQLLQSRDRGMAWTRALLGLPAREVHICGDATALDWVREVTAVTGEDLVVNQYERLSGVGVQDVPVGALKNLRRGDCVVCFSRRDVYWLRSRIEEATGAKVAIIYGSLPPSVRKLQAELFNDPNSGVDILVASDAIGMGLNLNIGRVVFSTVMKFDGDGYRRLLMTEIKQIGGRAGRFQSDFPHGWVTTMYSQEDLDYLKQLFTGDLPPMTQASLAPSNEHLLLFARRFPHLPLSGYLRNLAARAKLDGRYAIGDLAAMVDVAEAIDEFELEPHPRVMMCYAPIDMAKYSSQRVLTQHYAKLLCTDEPIDIAPSTYAARPGVPENAEGIRLLEETYANLDLYIWLSYRLGTWRFIGADAARRDRALISELIHTALTQVKSDKSKPHNTIMMEDSQGRIVDPKQRFEDVMTEADGSAGAYRRLIKGKANKIGRSVRK